MLGALAGAAGAAGGGGGDEGGGGGGGGEPTNQNIMPNINIIDNARQMINPTSPLPPINLKVQAPQYNRSS